MILPNEDPDVIEYLTTQSVLNWLLPVKTGVQVNHLISVRKVKMVSSDRTDLNKKFSTY